MYGEAKASGKIVNVRDILTKLYEHYASVHSPNVEVESLSEKSTTTMDVDVSETNLYALIESQYDLYLEVEQSMVVTMSLTNIWLKVVKVEKMRLLMYCFGGRPTLVGIKCCLKWLGMFWRYLFLLLLPSHHLVREGAYLIHFEVHHLLTWFKSLFAHKIGLNPQFQSLYAMQWMK